jgi:CBS domain-containing protein
MRVKQIMSQPVISVREESTLEEIAQIMPEQMLKHQINRARLRV